jgi:hypothetical protein
MGKTVDMASLSGRNEKVRAVGNMNVNARGDVLDSHNRVIQDNTQRVQASYRNTVSETPAHLTPSRPTSTIQEDTVVQEVPVELPVEEPVELTAEEQELFDDTDEEETK